MTFQNGRRTERRYWCISYLPKHNFSFHEAAERLAYELTEAVNVRLVSDVPVGILLSGGKDSSAILAAMGRRAAGVHSFTMGFRESGFDERPYARKAAQNFDTMHHEFVMEPAALDEVDRIVAACGEPFGDFSIVPLWFISASCRELVKVVLTGDGGDELLAGYQRYGGALAYRWASVVAAAALPLIRHRDSTALVNRTIFSRLLRAIELAGLREPARYADLQIFIKDRHRQEVYSPHFLAQVKESAEAWLEAVFRSGAGLGPLDRMLWTDAHCYELSQLMKVDIATMAHSIEARSPFVDHLLIEFVARMPEGYKRRGFQGKRLLTPFLRRYYPPASIKRPKHGFAMPLRHWFRGDLRAFCRERVLGGILPRLNWFNPRYLSHVLDAGFDRSSTSEHEIWNLVVLASFMEAMHFRA